MFIQSHCISSIERLIAWPALADIPETARPSTTTSLCLELTADISGFEIPEYHLIVHSDIIGHRHPGEPVPEEHLVASTRRHLSNQRWTPALAYSSSPRSGRKGGEENGNADANEQFLIVGKSNEYITFGEILRSDTLTRMSRCKTAVDVK